MSMHAHGWRSAEVTGIPRYEEPLAPAWDVGRPQRAIYELEMAGKIGASVLDVGCGGGEHALWLASRGHAVMGIDASARAIERARRRARKDGVAVDFVVGDVGAALPRKVDCAIDAGSFHRLAASERPAYARWLASVVTAGGGGRVYVLCFADRETGRGGPPRVTRDELRALFERGGEWAVDGVDESVIESRLFPGGAAGWLLAASRL